MAVSPEIMLISSIVLNDDWQTALAHGAADHLFHVCAEEWVWIKQYVAKYDKTPSKAALHRAFPDFRVRQCDDTAHFVDEVRSAHAQHRMTELMRDQADLIASGQVTEAAQLVLSNITTIAAEVGDVQEIDALNDWKPVYNEVKARKARFDESGMAGIPTGFPTLDERTGGIGRGWLAIVAARLGEGKSYTLLEIAAAALLGGYRVHFAALEMSRSEVQMRLHNLLSSAVGYEVFRSEQLAQGKLEDLAAYRRFLNDLPNKVKGHLTISDTTNIGEMEIAAQIERNKPDLYILDYLTLGKMGGEGGWQDIGKFSKACKNMAKRYNVGFIAAAQLNRQGVDKEAGAETIGGSDQIGQDADFVLFLKKMSTRMTEMRLVKFRHGRAGYKFYSFLDLETGTHYEVDKERAMSIVDQDQDRMDAEAEKATPLRKAAMKSIQQESLEEDDEPVAAYELPKGARKKSLRSLRGGQA